LIETCVPPAAHREDLVADAERDVDLPREPLLGLGQAQRDPPDVVERVTAGQRFSIIRSKSR
jgi:hypothetical protein